MGGDTPASWCFPLSDAPPPVCSPPPPWALSVPSHPSSSLCLPPDPTPGVKAKSPSSLSQEGVRGASLPPLPHPSSPPSLVTHAYTHTYAHECVHTYPYTHTQDTFTHARVHRRIYARMHTHVHTWGHTQSSLPALPLLSALLSGPRCLMELWLLRPRSPPDHRDRACGAGPPFSGSLPPFLWPCVTCVSPSPSPPPTRLPLRPALLGPFLCPPPWVGELRIHPRGPALPWPGPLGGLLSAHTPPYTSGGGPHKAFL